MKRDLLNATSYWPGWRSLPSAHDLATRLAHVTGIRRKVRWTGSCWVVEPR